MGLKALYEEYSFKFVNCFLSYVIFFKRKGIPQKVGVRKIPLLVWNNGTEMTVPTALT